MTYTPYATLMAMGVLEYLDYERLVRELKAEQKQSQARKPPKRGRH